MLPSHVRLSRYRRTFRIGHIADVHRLRAIVPPLIGVAALAALILAINPAAFQRAIAHMQLLLLPAIVAVSISYYLVQGLRWYFLLREVDITLPLRDVTLLTLAGQATALLPLGELTRAVFVTQVSGAEFGAVVATETVQELMYTMLLILFAIPGLLVVPNALPGVVAIVVVILAIFVAMSWCRVYRGLRWLVARTPVLRRALHQVDELHNDLVLLSRKPATFGWAWLSAVQAAAMVTALWLVARAIDPGGLSWQAAALVFAVSNVAGLLSLVPGGIGAYEGSIIGLLVGFGINPGVGAAIALIQRLCDKGVATAVGFAAYGVARKRLPISGLGTVPLRAGQDSQIAA